MKSFVQSCLVVWCILISGYARSQCTNLRFSSTSNAWPTVSPLPTMTSAIPTNSTKTQYLCLKQVLATPLPTAVRVYTSSAVPITGVTWTALGSTGINLTNQSNLSCDFQLPLSTGPDFDFGKYRIAVKYRGGSCECLDTLDIYRVMAPQATSSFSPINGPTCLVPGQAGMYFVEPRFSRPANIDLGIGIDGYKWNVNGTGSWAMGPQSTPQLIASGDGSARQILNISGWSTNSAIITVVQGTACGNMEIPLTVYKGAEPAKILASAIDPAYSNLTNNNTAAVTACLNAGTGNTPITLQAPSGSTYVWTLPTGGGFSFATGTQTSQTVTINANGNRSGVIQVTCTPLAGSCGSTTTATFTVTRRLTAANTITGPTNTCLLPASYNFTILNYPPDGGSNFSVAAPTGTTGISVGPIGNTGDFAVTVATGATASGTFSLFATNATNYGCPGNSGSISGYSIPGSGSTNFVLEAYDNFPAATSPAGIGKRTVYWNDSPINPGNSTNIPGNITWGGSFGGTCSESIFTYTWTFTGVINGVTYTNASPLVSGAFTSNTPTAFATLKPGPGITYGSTASPNCTITCTITSNSNCNLSVYSCYSRTQSITFTGPVTPTARPGGGAGDPTARIGMSDPAGSASILPNPNRGIFDLTVPETFVGSSARIIDMTGKEIHSILKLEKKQDIQLRKLPAGIYNLLIMNGEESDKISFQIQE